MHLSWMMLRKQGALNNQMLRLGCCLPPPSKFLATCLPEPEIWVTVQAIYVNTTMFFLFFGPNCSRAKNLKMLELEPEIWVPAPQPCLNVKSQQRNVKRFGVDQWFLAFSTYFTLLSNKITRFTPIHSIMLIYEYEINKLVVQKDL